MIVIGLTGGLASGKSTAARHLAELGAEVVDADRLGHAAYAPGAPAFQALRQAFGDQILTEDGAIDRKILGGKTFANASALQRLNRIVWPEIERLAKKELNAARARRPDGIAVLEAAVLIEAGWNALVDEVWALAVDRGAALRRAMARDGAELQAVQARLEAQLADEQRLAQADRIIDNSAGPGRLRAQLDREWQRLRSSRLPPFQMQEPEK